MPESAAKPTLLDRAWRNLRLAWRGIAGTAYDETTASLRPDLPDDDLERVRSQIRACLGAHGNEVSARAQAAALARAYLALDAGGRERFLILLAGDFDIDRGGVDAAIRDYRRAEGEAARRRAEQALRGALEAARVRLLTRFNGLPEGVKFLVDMRAELIEWSRDKPPLAALEQDLKALLVSWFDIGFLEMRRITWDSPASLLEKLVSYEAVHAITSWRDLKNRLDPDRRFFAFFHPAMPDEPLIFVEVALVNGLADNIQALLDERAPVQDPEGADTAIFYSISSAQKGLAGISFGDFLIKRVVDRLADEFKGLKTFATLSPIPGLRKWLEEAGAEPELLTPPEREALAVALGGGEELPPLATLLDAPDWHRDGALAQAMKDPLMRLSARYIIREKRADGRARDPVTHFHLTNGARVERINWLADTSPKGLRQSAGLMVNYLYRLKDIDANNQAYRERGEVAVSSAMRALAQG
ncbi:MAG: malonyl-CoA decarboxylase [Proteobacteria bacterium]|nr:malonyl-CoA decarboxylase [Pseudomonadota bacterium]